MLLNKVPAFKLWNSIEIPSAFASSLLEITQPSLLKAQPLVYFLIEAEKHAHKKHKIITINQCKHVVKLQNNTFCREQ